MKTIKTLALASSLLLMGCQGQNPFKGSSNPVKDYPSATNQNVKPYVPGEQQEVKPAPDNTQQVCLPPMQVSINPEHGSLLMLFTEDESSTYQVEILNRAGQAYDIGFNHPEGASVKEVKKDLQGALYEFTWKPGKSRGTRAQHKILEVVYTYKAQINALACGEASVKINLATDKTSLQPTTSIVGLSEALTYSTEPVGFTIEVNDPASTPEFAPDIKEITFRNQGSTGRRGVLDASAAVDCQDGTLKDGTTWVFTCAFNSSLVKGVDALLNSGKENNATFTVTATSKRNQGKDSIPATATVKISFPKTGA